MSRIWLQFFSIYIEVLTINYSMEMVEMCTDLLQDAVQYKADLNVLT